MRSLSAPIVDALVSIVGSNAVLTRAEDVVPYSFDGTAALNERPAAVVFPQTTEQVPAAFNSRALMARPSSREVQAPA